MFTAEEAKALSDKANTFSERLKYALSAIKSAAKIGNYSVGLYDLSEDVVEKLIELGYSISDGEYGYLTISWDKEEE